ncbi:phosphohydrolase [Endozoicomonas ascidiicola]|uniref:phosphohydrolase n=1 Tax=Endozoicomonas ascidiicola TaxID=1698521 RepID=UPI000831D5A3|nr:phosphohydrolase [Endozoicomonas ascidiicola]
MTDTCPNVLKEWEQCFIDCLQNLGQDHDDASHDFFHFQRVWKTACQILDQDGAAADRLVVLAACYFHDVVVLPKNHPERSKASKLAAAKARELLQHMAFPEAQLESVCHAIESHSYSAGIVPETLEAKVVQDADRMEALGAIGLARVFYTSGVLRQKMFDPEDPMAEHRELSDRQFALDHFEQKLLRLPETMQTNAGREMAERNARYLADFRAKLLQELQGDYS